VRKAYVICYQINKQQNNTKSKKEIHKRNYITKIQVSKKHEKLPRNQVKLPKEIEAMGYHINE
jgi:hypothetical protein